MYTLPHSSQASPDLSPWLSTLIVKTPAPQARENMVQMVITSAGLRAHARAILARAVAHAISIFTATLVQPMMRVAEWRTG